MNEQTHYTGTAKSLHWLMALMIFGLLALGLYMADLPLSPEKLKLYSWHKWAGVTLFVLLLPRLAWRISHRPPALPEHMSKMVRLTSHLAHIALYVLMVALPLSGCLMSSAKGYQTVWFGILPIPDLIPKDKVMGDYLKEVHESLSWVLMMILAAHIVAAIKHHFVDKDDVLMRMLPKRTKESAQTGTEN